MIDYHDLLEASRLTGPMYAPTSFWEMGGAQIVADLARSGIENFRNRGAPLGFFVPTYGAPGNSLSGAQIEAIAGAVADFGPKQKAMVDQWLTGHAHALSDYRASVFVKHVVRRFHAASLISGALISVSGLSQTGPTGCQLRVLPDQRSGFCARAFA